MATITITAGPISATIRPNNTALLEHIDDMLLQHGLDPVGLTNQQKADWLLRWFRDEVVERVNSYRSQVARAAAVHVSADLDDE